MTTLVAAVLAAATLGEEMWSAAQPVYRATLRHPFLQGLADGSLPRASFHFYLIEDAAYLRVFSRALSALAAKAPRDDWAMTLNRHAVDAIQAERELHESLLKAVPRTDRPMAPTNYAYGNHLLATVSRGSFAEGLAALLPCYWIYWEVGKELKRRGSKNADYQRWIDQYASEGYGKVVGQVIDMMNAEGASLTGPGRQRAIELFVIGARYEYMFWDMAWKREQWPPGSR